MISDKVLQREVEEDVSWHHQNIADPFAKDFFPIVCNDLLRDQRCCVEIPRYDRQFLPYRSASFNRLLVAIVIKVPFLVSPNKKDAIDLDVEHRIHDMVYQFHSSSCFISSLQASSGKG